MQLIIILHYWTNSIICIFYCHYCSVSVFPSVTQSRPRLCVCVCVCEAAIQPDAAQSAKTTSANGPPGVSSVFPSSLFPSTVPSFYTVLDHVLLLLLSVRLFSSHRGDKSKNSPTMCQTDGFFPFWFRDTLRSFVLLKPKQSLWQ